MRVESGLLASSLREVLDVPVHLKKPTYNLTGELGDLLLDFDRVPFVVAVKLDSCSIVCYPDFC